MKSNSNGNYRPKKIKYIIIGIVLASTIITIVSIYRINFSPRSKNERAIEAVMKSLLTCPDIELNRLIELSALKVGPGFVEEPKPEDFERYNNKVNDMFGSYLTEITLDYIKASAFRYHTIAEEKGSEIQVEDIEINQDNIDSRNYTFTLHLYYTSPDADKKQLVVNGRAQCLEAGKITFLRFSDDFFKNEFVNSY